MVLDIQTVHHILKNTAVQNVNKPFVYITDLTSTLIIPPRITTSLQRNRQTQDLDLDNT
jgi:hypothetical protein